MSDIVVFDLNKPLDPDGSDRAQRQSGMERLGKIFNEKFMDPNKTDFQVVNETIQDVIALNNFIVTYKDRANVLSIKSRSKGTYYYDKTTTPKKVLRLKARKDEKENYDGDYLDVMNIAVPAGNFDLIDPAAGGTYLSKVITDLGATDSESRRKYLLGTITFRRCR
jgi:hypothetical protein